MLCKGRLLGRDFIFFLFFFFLWLYLEVPRLGVDLELQLLAHAPATAMPDLSGICDLHQSLWQRWVLNSLNQATDQICILTETMLGA